MESEQLLMLIVYGLVPYFARMLIGPQLDTTLLSAGQGIQQFGGWTKLLIAAIPEQAVLYFYEPNKPILDRCLVSVAMIVIHCSWNGFGNTAPQRAYNELVWIFGTGLYAYQVVKVRLLTATMLILCDATFTLLLRGIVT